MNSTSPMGRPQQFLCRSLAALLALALATTAVPIPAYALRAGQEKETHAAGLEDALRKGQPPLQPAAGLDEVASPRLTVEGAEQWLTQYFQTQVIGQTLHGQTLHEFKVTGRVSGHPEVQVSQNFEPAEKETSEQFAYRILKTVQTEIESDVNLLAVNQPWEVVIGTDGSQLTVTFSPQVAVVNTTQIPPIQLLAETMELMELGNSTATIQRERAGQQELVQSDVLPVRGTEGHEAEWEAMGVILDDPVAGDPLFRHVTLPVGWKIVPTDHHMWSDLVDAKGQERAQIFYKAAFYDRRAHVQFVNRHITVQAMFDLASGNAALQLALIERYIPDKDPEVRRIALDVLKAAELTPEQREPMVQGFLRQLSRPQHYGWYSHSEDQAIVEAVLVIEPDVVQRVGRELADSDKRDRAMRTLFHFGPRAQDTVPALLTLLKDSQFKNSYGNLDVIKLLGSMGAAAETAVPVIEEKLFSLGPQEDYFARILVSALGKIGSPISEDVLTRFASETTASEKTQRLAGKTAIFVSLREQLWGASNDQQKAILAAEFARYNRSEIDEERFRQQLEDVLDPPNLRYYDAYREAFQDSSSADVKAILQKIVDVLQEIEDILHQKSAASVPSAPGTSSSSTAGLEERPVTVLPPGAPVPTIPESGIPDAVVEAERQGQRTEVVVPQQLHWYYTTDSVGSTVMAWAEALKRGQPLEYGGVDFGLFQPLPGSEPEPYSIVVKMAGETVPDEAKLRANHVAIIDLTPEKTFLQVIQEALAQWTGRPIGQVLGVQQLEDGRLAIYV